MVGGDVDRTAPRTLDARLREPGQQPPQPVIGTGRRRAVAREPLVERAAEPDRARTAAHEHASVVRRAEVVQEHAAVDDRLAVGPADLLEEVRNGLGEDDVRAEVGHVRRDRPPAGSCRVDRDDDLRRTHSPGRRPDLAVPDPRRRAVLVQLDPGFDHAPPERAHEPRGLHGCAVREEDAAPEHRRPHPLGHAVAVERNGLLGHAGGRRRRDRVLHRGILGRRGRDHEHPALAQPDVVASERAHRRDDALAGTSQLERRVAAEQRYERRQRRPVAVDEPPVAAARPGAARRSLEHDDTRGRLALPHGKRSPEPGIAAADHADVRRDLAVQRSRGRVCACLVPPPRGEGREDAQAVEGADRSRRICTRTFTSMAVTATTKIAVPITFTCGGAPIRAAPQTNSGNVVSDPALKYVTTKSSMEIAKQSSKAARIAGAISGSVTLRNVTHSFAPRSIAASSRCLSKPTSRAFTVTTAKLMQNMMCAIRIVQKPKTTLKLRKSVSSEAPSTISGVDSGRKMRMFVAPRPRKPYRTSASAISVPSTVATMLAKSAISSERKIALRMPGTPSQ